MPVANGTRDDAAAVETIHVVGFVSDDGVGGFEWSSDRVVVEEIRAGWLADGDCDVSLVRSLDRPSGDVTGWLDGRPELWEPRVGEGR